MRRVGAFEVQSPRISTAALGLPPSTCPSAPHSARHPEEAPLL